jgi:hypothetical protein
MPQLRGNEPILGLNKELQNNYKQTRFTEQRRSGKNRFICVVGYSIIYL